jgi:biopolymer transport protein ExbD
MITRPLDLAARLRPEPRNFDAWFFVNVGLLVPFFLFFGSRFILAPGFGVDFRLPEVVGARAGAATSTQYLTVLSSGQIYVDSGQITMPQLGPWLQAEARKTPGPPSLLVRASANVTHAQMTQIFSIAHAAGFQVIWAADEAAAPAGR